MIDICIVKPHKAEQNIKKQKQKTAFKAYKTVWKRASLVTKFFGKSEMSLEWALLTWETERIFTV